MRITNCLVNYVIYAWICAILYLEYKLGFVWTDGIRCSGAVRVFKYSQLRCYVRDTWQFLGMFGSFKIEWSGTKWSGMDSIPFHHLPSYFFASDLGRIKNLPYSVLKCPTDGTEFSFCSAPFRFIPLHFFPLCSVHFMISKHSLNDSVGIFLLVYVTGSHQRNSKLGEA